MKRLMKASVLTLVALVAACSSQGEDNADQGSGVGKAGPRKIVESPFLPTTPANLILDPGFDITTGSYGSWVVLSDDDKMRALWKIPLSTSPGGVSGGTTIIQAEKSRLLTSFLGGRGPFVAQVWVSTTDEQANPTDTIEKDTTVTASIATGFPQGETIELTRVPDQIKVIQSYTWVLFRGEITRALPEGGFMLVNSGSTGGRVLVSAPQVTSEEVTVGMNVRSLGSPTTSKTRALTSSEVRAIDAYRARTAPKLAPASPDEAPRPFLRTR